MGEARPHGLASFTGFYLEGEERRGRTTLRWRNSSSLFQFRWIAGEAYNSMCTAVCRREDQEWGGARIKRPALLYWR